MQTLDPADVIALGAALLTFLATISGAYLVFRGQLAKIRADANAAAQQHQDAMAKLEAELARAKTEAAAAKRDDDRDDMQALWAENRQLRADLASQDKRHREELAELRGATEARIAGLEREMDFLRGKACPWGRVDCPRERQTAPVSVGRKE